MEIGSYEQLEEIEAQIADEVRRYRTDVVLLFLTQALADREKEGSVRQRVFPPDKGGLPEFVGAGTASFAFRHSNPYRGRDDFGWRQLAYLTDLVASYLLADPIIFDESLRETFLKETSFYLALRHVAAQFPFQVNTFGSFAQPRLLFGEMPRLMEGRADVPKFDLEGAFRTVTRVSLQNFIDVGFVTWAAAAQSKGVTRGYYRKAIADGIRLPDDDTVVLVLNNIAADSDRFREQYDRMKEVDRRFRMYDFNPLIAFPVLRPWKRSGLALPDQDRMVAPIPDLVASRCSAGIFYQLAATYGQQFLEYFGFLFEAYVGRILRESVPADSLFSEKDIRRTFPERRGKVPDWVVGSEDVAVAVECKATRFSRAAVATAQPELVDKSLAQLVKGLVQLHEFEQAVSERKSGLERFHSCKEVLSVVVTLEPLYLVNSKVFSTVINPLLHKEGATGFSFQVVSLKELEVLQPHLAAGQSLPVVLQEVMRRGFESALAGVVAATGRTYGDSFLYKANEEMYARLGIPR